MSILGRTWRLRAGSTSLQSFLAEFCLTRTYSFPESSGEHDRQCDESACRTNVLMGNRAYRSCMRRRTAIALIIVILAGVFVFTAPVVSATTVRDACSPSVGGMCILVKVHFTQSVDCYLLRAGPGQWIGVYYFQGAFSVGCGPLLF
jgi:hypothetical protein